MRSGDYSKAEVSCRACLECGPSLKQNIREKAEARLKLAKAGLRLAEGYMGRSTYQPGVPDSWFTQHPDSDIVRMCWGWRTELETSVRESEPKRVAEIIAANDFMKVGDVDGMHRGCPSGWDESRRGSGYNGCTPLYGASQGGPVAQRNQGPGSLEGRAQVAAYLLKHGANPMAKSDKPHQITPLFIACINNALPIVKLMIESGRADVAAAIPDGNTPLAAVRSCVSEGFDEYRPLLKLLEAELAASSSVPNESDGQLAVALSMKEAGNRSFRASEYSQAAVTYKRTIELCEQVRTCAGADLAACDELQVTAYSNAAAAYLHLGRSYSAEKFCEAALKLQPDHTKAKARLEAARKASRAYEADFLRPYRELMDRVNTLAAKGQYPQGAEAARRAAAMAAGVSDGLLEAKAYASLSEMCLAHAVDAEDAALAEHARDAANTLLAHCHTWEKKHSISNSRTDDQSLGAQLRSYEAMAWLYMARLDISARDNVAEGRRKLTGEVLRLLALIQQSCSSDNVEMSVYLAEANARQLIVQASTLLNEWDKAEAAATKLLDFVEDFDSVAFRCDHLCPFVVMSAESLAEGTTDGCARACERLFRYAIEQAERHGQVPTQAKWVRKLMNVTRSPAAYVRERDDDSTLKISRELLGLLRKMGRRTDECAICLAPLDATDAANPIDVLECMHCFHVKCVREHVHKNGEVSRTSEHAFANDIHSVGGTRMAYCLNGSCPECRAPIQLLGAPAPVRAE